MQYGGCVISGIFSIPLGKHQSAFSLPVAAVANARVRLQEFITDADNHLPRVAVLDAVRPHPNFNPLWVHGPADTGKSLFAEALVRHWLAENPHQQFIALSGEAYCRSVAIASQTNALTDLRSKHRAVRLFALDGLEHLAGKKTAQHELLYTIDTLLQQTHRVVVVSREPVADLQGIAPGLVSRLSAGLIIPFHTPTLEARRELLLRLSEIHDVDLSEQVIGFLADRLSGTVSLLSEAVFQLKQASLQLDSPLDLEFARQFLDRRAPNAVFTPRFITSLVCKYFAVKPADLKGPSRRQSLVRARGIAMLLCRRTSNKTLKQIGRFFGGRDHSTVLHACRTIEALAECDAEVQNAIDDLLRLARSNGSAYEHRSSNKAR